MLLIFQFTKPSFDSFYVTEFVFPFLFMKVFMLYPGPFVFHQAKSSFLLHVQIKVSIDDSRCSAAAYWHCVRWALDHIAGLDAPTMVSQPCAPDTNIIVLNVANISCWFGLGM